MDETSKNHWRIWLAIALTAMVICAIDLMIPLGVAGAVPYVAVVLISLWLPRYRDMIVVAAGCTVLTIFGWWLSPNGGEAWKVASNRGLAVFAIWVTVTLAHQYRISVARRFRSLLKNMPSGSSMPLKGFTAALVLTVAVFVGLGVEAWLSYQASEAHQSYDVHLFKLGGDIVFLDEALTMSVHMASVTGESLWEDRYKSLVEQLDAVLEDATRLAERLNVGDDVGQIKTANENLIALEQVAFSKIRNGRLDDAQALLSSEAYLHHKAVYASGMSQIIAAMKRHSNLEHEAQEARTFGALAAVGVALPVMFCAWVYTLVTLRDHFTQRKTVEMAMRNQVAFESLVLNLSTKFINLKPGEIDGGIHEALETIACFSGVDRSYIFQFSSDRKSVSNSYEWCAEGIIAHKDELQDLATDTFPWIMPQYLRGEMVYIPCVVDMPTEASAEKEELQRQGIQSIICVPLIVGGEVMGFVGFDSVHSEKVWANETISLLRVVGELFANAIARKEAGKALHQAHEDLEKRVGQRTRELASSNKKLKQEVSERKRAEMILHTVVEGTSSVVGSDFLASLVCNLAQSLQAKYAFVVEHERSRPIKSVCALASWMGDKHGEPFNYEIADTPCEETVSGKSVYYPSGVQARFPKDHLLVDLGVESYCGIPLFSDDGWVFGHLVVMDTKPMTQNLVDMPVMRIFAARAAVELERNRTEIALRDNESRYRALYENNPSMFFTVDAHQTVLSVNHFGAEQLGYTPQQLIGKSVMGVVYEADRNIVRDQLTNCLKYPGTLFHWEFRKVRKDGSILWVGEAGRSVPGDDNHGSVVLIVCEDITSQKQADDLMHFQTEVLENVAKGVELSETFNTLCHFVERVIDQSVCAVMLLEQDGALKVTASPSMSNAHVAVLDGLVPSDQATSCGAAVCRGEPVFVADTSNDPTWVDFRDFADRFGARGCWSMPICVDGQTVTGTFSICRTTTGLPNAFGRQILEMASHVAGIAIGRKRTQDQIRQHQEELAHVTRLSTVGELASGLAHEINQPLAAISNYVQVCAGELRSGQWDQGELVGTMDKASGQCHRASEIIRRLRDFISKRATLRNKVDINRVVHEAMDLVQSDPRSTGVNIELELNENLDSVNVDGIQIEQVIINLAKNSLDAMDGNREHKRRLKICTALSNKKTIQVSMKDTGSGLPEGNSNKVFEPFFTTKPDGMGMGLSISRTIIESHGGRMGVSNNSDRGVTFQFTLPVNAGA